MGQKSIQLTYLEKVQHPIEKSRAKNFFAKVIKVVAKVYSCEKSGYCWALQAYNVTDITGLHSPYSKMTANKLFFCLHVN